MDSAPLSPLNQDDQDHREKNSPDSSKQAPPNSSMTILKNQASHWKWILPLLALFLLGTILFFLKENRFLNRFPFFQPTIGLETESARLWVHYATLQHHLGEFPEAIAAYQQACTLDPNLYEAWWNLSQIYSATHQPQEQLNALQQAVRSRPESPEAWGALTKLYRELNQEQEAALSRTQEAIAQHEMTKEEEFEQITFENPSNVQSWLQWGMSRVIYRFVQPNSYDPKTAGIFQKAVENNPLNPWLSTHLGLSMIKKRNEIPGSPFLVEVEVPNLIPFQKSAELLPRDPTVFFLLGRAAFWKGEWNIAINAFQIATQSPNAHWLAWYYLGETYLAANRSDEAIATYSKAQSLSPETLEIQYGIAQAFLQKGKIDEARAILERQPNEGSLKLIPLTRRTYVQIELHRTLARQSSPSNQSKANSPLLQSLRADSIPRLEVFTPENISPEITKNNPDIIESPLKHRSPELPLLRETETQPLPSPQPISPVTPQTMQTNSEAPSAEEKISLRPPSLASLSSDSSIETKREEFDNPQELRKRLQEESLDEKTLMQIIAATEKTENLEIALEAAQQLAQRSHSALNWITLGYIYGIQNQTIKEMESYQKALNIDPKNRTALFNLGLAQLQLRRHKKAENTFEKITEINPQDLDAWFHRGLALERQERWNEASISYQKAISLDPTYVNAWLNLGGVYASIKRADLEVETYKKCLEVNPDYQPAWNNLAIVLKSIGKFSDYEITKKRIESTSHD